MFSPSDLFHVILKCKILSLCTDYAQDATNAEEANIDAFVRNDSLPFAGPDLNQIHIEYNHTLPESEIRTVS